MEDAIQFASLTGVKHLLPTHHDPMHCDAQLHQFFKRLKENVACSISYEVAYEGLKLEL